MLDKLSRFIVAIAVLFSALLAGAVVYTRGQRDRFKHNATALADTLKVRDSIAIIQIAEQGKALLLIDTLTGEVNRVLRDNAVLRAESARLRRQQADVPLVPSVPGEAPTTGDTLRQCRQQLALCEERAAIEKQRADSVEMYLQRAVLPQLNSLRADVFDWQQSNQINTQLLRRAEGLLAKAQAPCRVAFFDCPSRTDALLYGVAGTLLATAKTPEQRYLAVGLIALSFRF